VSSQLAQYGDQALVNTLSGQAVPVASAVGSPPAWFPGLIWYNTTATAFQQWNGTAWSASPTPAARYLALLTTDPVAGGAVNIADAGFVEMTTSGYSRQLVTFTQATATYPSQASNNSLITFGPMGTTMAAPVQWVALVTSASGTGGYFLASWSLLAPISVNASQSIYVGLNQLILQGQ